ncbi:hypothetical protein L6452_35421 [Arctium lappa]|uniref:Uncharacterized protein n=1 Tax=Arctium lappa TaxID=4217 RepID=A0ACB8YAK6_ARCLA|nr:hypothetical protein L6452_35421 [Arctium lappa]
MIASKSILSSSCLLHVVRKTLLLPALHPQTQRFKHQQKVADKIGKFQLRTLIKINPRLHNIVNFVTIG